MAIPRKKILLVDDHAVVRAGLMTLINQQADLIACGEADSERAALEIVRQLQPDVVVADWSLGHHDAASLVEALRTDYPEMPVLVLSIHDEALYAERAFRAGATGYVMKQEATEKIVDAIRSVSAGRPFLSARAAQAVNAMLYGEREADRAERSEEAAAARAHSIRSLSRPDSAPKVSIVIPVFNSERTIVRLVERLVTELDHRYRLQIILVDDGSTDHSVEACERLHRRNPELVDFVTLSRNFGEHNAVMAGLNCADGDFCVIMDDDFQNPPSEVATLIAEIQRGHDVVYVRYEAKQHSWFRNVGSHFHNWMATRVLGKPPQLYLSSFKVMSRFLVREVVHYTGPDPYLDAIILRTTRKIGVVSANHEARQEGKSGYTVGKLLSLWGNMVVAFSIYPLRLLGLAGLAMTVFGVAYGLMILVAYLRPGQPRPDSIQQLSAGMWFFRGIHLLAIALVGEYVGRIYRQQNRDPQFIIRQIHRHRP